MLRRGFNDLETYQVALDEKSETVENRREYQQDISAVLCVQDQGTIFQDSSWLC